MNTNNLHIIQVEEFVTDLLCDLPNDLCYHNLKHTKEVVNASKILSEKSGLSAGETEIVMIAAWFHDSGHAVTYFGHEEAGAKIAEKFLQQIQYPNHKTEKVISCILATQYPPRPKNELQRILCDADMYHLTLNDYEKRAQSLKIELESITSTQIPNQDWCQKNVDFLKDHCYFTSYGKKVLHFLKEKNLHKYFVNHFKE